MSQKPRCGCSTTVIDLFGAATVAQLSIPIRQAWFRRYGARAGYRPPLPSLLEPPGRGGADTRLQLWLWLYLEAHHRAEHGQLSIACAKRRELAGRLHLLRSNEFGNDRVRDSRARRIDNALRHLQSHKLIERRSGGRVLLCNHLGSGNPYEVETDLLRDERRKRREALIDHVRNPRSHEAGRAATNRYEADDLEACVNKRSLGNGFWLGDEWEGDAIRVPLSFWANGWASTLPARALLALLVLLDVQSCDETDWFGVPRVLQSQFTLGPDVWQSGLARLVREGIVDQRVDGTMGFVNRKQYRLNLEVIRTRSCCPR